MEYGLLFSVVANFCRNCSEPLKILSLDLVGHCTVHCQAAWPGSGSEAGIHFVMAHVSFTFLLYLKAKVTSNMQLVSVK